MKTLHLNTQKIINMLKEEAQEILAAGGKLTHRYFNDNECIRQEGCMIITEEGYSIEADLFWADRSGVGFTYGWELCEYENLEVGKTYSFKGVYVKEQKLTGQKLLFMFLDNAHYIIGPQYFNDFIAEDDTLLYREIDGEVIFPESFTVLDIIPTRDGYTFKVSTTISSSLDENVTETYKF